MVKKTRTIFFPSSSVSRVPHGPYRFCLVFNMKNRISHFIIVPNFSMVNAEWDLFCYYGNIFSLLSFSFFLFCFCFCFHITLQWLYSLILDCYPIRLVSTHSKHEKWDRESERDRVKRSHVGYVVHRGANTLADTIFEKWNITYKIIFMQIQLSVFVPFPFAPPNMPLSLFNAFNRIRRC